MEAHVIARWPTDIVGGVPTPRDARPGRRGRDVPQGRLRRTTSSARACRSATSDSRATQAAFNNINCTFLEGIVEKGEDNYEEKITKQAPTQSYKNWMS